MMNPQPKVKTPRSEKYKKFIRKQRCLLTDGTRGLCSGDIVPHHTETGGTSLKGSDYSCIPLCVNHHHDMDNAGKKGRGIWTEKQLSAIIGRLNTYYVTQGNKIGD